MYPVQAFEVTTITDEMVRAATNGSAVDRGLLLGRLAPQLRAMVLVRLAPSQNQWHAVDDLAQQATASVAQGLPGLRNPTTAALNAYASTVVTRAVANFLRQRASNGVSSSHSLDSSIHGPGGSVFLRDLLSASSLTPGAAAVQAEDMQRVILALGNLKPDYREIITLAFFDQLGLAEIADCLGLSRPAASMLLTRAMKTLRRRLTGSGTAEGSDDRGA
jgi:RNA polymerase sigma factor (sigma-70 family)